MRNDITQKLTVALHAAIESVLGSDNMNRIVTRQSRKITLNRFDCSRIKPFQSDEEPRYCKKCILCFLHSQKMLSKSKKIMCAPAKQRTIKNMARPSSKIHFFYYISYHYKF